MLRGTALGLLLALLLTSCGGSDDAQSKPVEEPAPTVSTLELTMGAATTGRCMLPSVENLQAQDTAIEGVVTEVTPEQATLDVAQSFKGDDVDTITVALPGEVLQDLALAVTFEVGQTYLVSSLDGQVSVCGLSGPKDELLTDLYEQAYAE